MSERLDDALKNFKNRDNDKVFIDDDETEDKKDKKTSHRVRDFFKQMRHKKMTEIKRYVKPTDYGKTRINKNKLTSATTKEKDIRENRNNLLKRSNPYKNIDIHDKHNKFINVQSVINQINQDIDINKFNKRYNNLEPFTESIKPDLRTFFKRRNIFFDFEDLD